MRTAMTMLDRSRAYWLVGFALLWLMVGANLPSPLYAVYMRLWHFSPTMLTLIFASYALALIPTLLLLGHLSDQVGRRPILLGGLMMAAAASAVFALAQGVTWLFIARMTQGIAVGMMSGAATAALVELHPQGDLRHAALVASIATAGGTALGPALSGLLAQYGPAPLAFSYWIQAAFSLPVLLGVWVMPETVAKTSATMSWRPSLGVPKSIRKPFVIAAMTAFVAWAVAALYMALVPAYVMKLLHISNLAVAGSVVFAMLGVSSVAQSVLKRVPPRLGMVVGLALLVVGLEGVVLAVPMQSLELIALGTLVTGVGQGLAFGGSMALINQIAPPEQRGRVVSSFYVVIYLGVGLPVIGTGLAATQIGLYRAVSGFALVIALIGAAIAYVVARNGNLLSK